ncbi:hydroxymethylbilane synthase [Sulfurimonas sp. MAG313]|nr:hydroxymethylbilane synthase [Sulfurimonas sp. MAG313]MDF1882147.1 hydroxymethylbilane synthase [Sulfurimonas sp. MAG313]
MKKIVIATRGSKLALWQSEHIKARLEELSPGLEVSLKIIVTSGDKIQDVSLSKIGGKGLFLKELEEAMLRGEAHMAVHSLKDVPTVMPKELPLAAITEREDCRDALLSEKYASIKDLPKGSSVGTSSLRRKMQLLMIRPDLEIKDLRGNVDTRIRKLKEGQFDAIILASAGINRLGFVGLVKHVYNIEQDEMVSSMGQGALGLQTIDDKEIFDLVHQLNHKETQMEVTVERHFVDILEGGCHVPIGVNAKVMRDGTINVLCTLGLPDASEVLCEHLSASHDDYETLGKDLAQIVIDKGARELLARADKMD